MSNPLVADVKSSTEAYSGVSLLESAVDLKSAIESGDWASVAMGSVGTALDALSMAMDPFGAALAAGVGWLIEHCGPLKEALDALAGDPDQIKANSETWANVAKELGAVGEDLSSMVTTDLVSWTGVAADAYRQRASDTVALLGSAKEGSEGASSGVKTAGEVVAAVRALVRDIIAELIGHMISWALQVVFTLGIGLAWVVPQVVAAVAKTASQIASITGKLMKALKALVPLLKKAGDLFADAAKALKNVKGGKVAPPVKTKDLPPSPKGPDTLGGGKGGDGPGGGKGGGEGPGGKGDGDTTPSSTPPPTPKGGDGSTTPSGAGGGNGSPPPPKPETPDAPPPPKADPPPPVSRGLGDGGKTPDTNGKTNPSASPNKPSPPRDRAVGSDDRVCKSDPIDIATGEMILTQTDLELPALGLVLERTHVSSYRAGQWFGGSWASTVDQRLEVDDENVCYFSPDGMILVYPVPVQGMRVLPVEGPRLPLDAHGLGGYTIEEPSGRVLRFGRRAGTAALPLIAVENTDGSRIDVEHGPSGAPVLLTHSDGNRVALHHDRSRVTELRVLDPTGGPDVLVLGYRYDTLGRLIEVVNSSGLPLVFDYDTADRIVGWQDRTGTWYRYIYDADGRCVRTVGAGGFYDGSFAYDRERLVTTYTDSLGNVSESHINAANQLVREVDALGNATTLTWDRYDNLLSRTDPLGRTTSYEYDVSGELAAVVRADGNRLAVTRTAADGSAVLDIEFTDGEQTWRRSYDPAELPDPFKAPIGVATVPADADGDQSTGPVAVADVPAESGPGRTSLELDQFGRPRAATGGRWAWTIEGKLLSRSRAGGGLERWRYDSDGNETEYVDPAGRVTKSEYGTFGLLTATTDPSGARTTYGYDTELQLTEVTTAAGLTWRYRYDAAGNMTEQTDFDGRTTRYDYDAAGQVVRTTTAAGEVVDFTYDVLGNLVKRVTPTGTTNYRYDPVGRLVAASGRDAVLLVERDDDGRVLAQHVNGRSVTFAYDDDERLVERRTPAGVAGVWSHDANGQPEALATAGHLVRFAHDGSGREIHREVNGVSVLRQGYGVEGHLASQRLGGGHLRQYHYLPDGRLTMLDDEVLGRTRFQLDATGRVSEVTGTGRAESYRYDDLGNLTTASPGDPAAPEEGPREYFGTSLLRAGAVDYVHDVLGRLITRTVGGDRQWRYEWDTLDRLVAVTTPEGVRWRYLYDPLGRRISKQRLSVRNPEEVIEEYLYAWDGTTVIEEEHATPDGRREILTWHHHPVDGRPVTQTERVLQAENPVDGGDRFHTVVTDMIGSPTLLADAAGKVTWQSRDTLWGTPGDTGKGTPLRFPGQHLDDETGLHYNVYRYYDPATGRYLSPDPLGLEPAPNPVAYVPNPLWQTDPLGLTTPCQQAANSKKRKSPDSGNDSNAAASTSSGPQPKKQKKEPNSKFNPGQHGYKSHEQKYQAEKFGTEVKGNFKGKGGTHESEHSVGYDVLGHDSGVGRGKSDFVKDIEDKAPAYQEDIKSHQGHIGTGGKGSMGDPTHTDPAKQGPHFSNPDHKDLYGYPAGQYRKDLTTMVKDDDFPNAVQLNQLGYAHTPAFHDSKGTVGGKVADDSYGRMVDNMGEVKYATGKNPATDFASTSQPLAYQRAEMYLSREAANTKEWPSIERQDEVMKYFMDRTKNGIPSNPPEMKHAPADAMDLS